MILHLDMDAFFAQVEQMDNPDLRGKPVIVGGSGARGVVSTASYEARQSGVHSAMPMPQARRLCPHGVFLPGNYRRYGEISHAIMNCLEQFSPLVEPASIDEAYLDATGLGRLFGTIPELIAAIKARVRGATGGLTCSVGAAPVKFLAKICSDINKPDGVFLLRPEDVDDFLLPLPVEKLPGVGRQMAASLHGVGIATVAEARRYGRAFFLERYGKWGTILFDRLHGIDPRPVIPERAGKSESSECTFDTDTRDAERLCRALLHHAERVGAALRRHGKRGRTITLKVKFADFRQVTRSMTLNVATSATKTIYENGCKLLRNLPLPEPVRLIGLGVSGFGRRPEQLVLPGTHVAENSDPLREARRGRLDSALDTLRERFGRGVIQRGTLFASKPGNDDGESSAG